MQRRFRGSIFRRYIYTGINRRELSVGDPLYFTVSVVAPKGATVAPRPTPSRSSIRLWSKSGPTGNLRSQSGQYRF